jgi:hypothetical protein
VIVYLSEGLQTTVAELYLPGLPYNTLVIREYMRLSTLTLLLSLSLSACLPSWATPRTQTVPTLTVFPNPSRGLLTVQVAGLPGLDYKLRLANVLGRELRLTALRPEQANEGMTIDLTGLPAGMYFYSLLVNDKTISTKRLILQGD